MAVFVGEFRSSIDEKGRLALPVKIRKKRASELVPLGPSAKSKRKTDDSLNDWVFTYGYDRCVMGMPRQSWQVFVNEKISSLSKSVKENRQRARFLLSGALECELDKQGRFIVPVNLKDYADIKKDVVVIGVGGFIEIWDENRYDAEMKMDPKSLDSFASQFWE